MKRIITLLALLTLFGCSNGLSETEQEVLDTLQAMFDAMEQQDVAASRQLLIADGQFHSLDLATNEIRNGSFAGYLESLENKGRIARELIESPSHVVVQGRIASVTTRYSLYVNDQWNHSGNEVFTLVRQQDQWLITGAVYSVNREKIKE